MALHGLNRSPSLTRISRRAFVARASAAVSLGILSACTPQVPEPAVAPAKPPEVPRPAGTAAPAAAKRTGEVLFLHSGVLRSLDPHSFYAGFEMRTWQHIYDPLVGLSPTGDKFVGRMAESWSTSQDGLAWTFNLRKGVKFSNGDDLTSEAVRATFQRAIDNKKLPYSFMFDPISSIETPDPFTVIIRTKLPTASFLGDLSICYIAHPNIAKAGGEAWNEAIGAGPFKVIEFKPNEQLVLEGRADYWEPGIPKLNRLTIRRVAEESARIAGIMSGEAQATEALPFQAMQQLVGHATLNPLNVTLWGYGVLHANLNRPMLESPKIRQAISYAIDRQALTANVMQSGRPLATYPPEGVLGYDASLPANPYDPEKAKQLIKEAGTDISGEMKLNFGVGQWARVEEETQFIADQLRQVGFNVSVNSMEAAAEQVARASGNHDMFVTEGNVITGDPHVAFATYVLADPYKEGFTEKYKNDPMMETLRMANQVMDASKREELYKAAGKLLSDNPPRIYLYQNDWPLVYNKKLIDPPTDPTRLLNWRATGWAD